jgi:hypothetical protein
VAVAVLLALLGEAELGQRLQLAAALAGLAYCRLTTLNLV